MTMEATHISLLAYTAILPLLSIGQGHQLLLRPEASWDVAVYESPTICGWVSARNWFIDGDTVINGATYARFGYRTIADIDGPPFCPPGYYVIPATTITNLCLREDTVASLVFQYDHVLQSDRLLYDYNLELGDTIHDYFDFRLLGWPPTPTIIVSLDSVQLNDGVFHRRWGLSTTLWGEVLHDFIEGVGSTTGITHELPQYYGDGAHLWCYKRNEVDVLWSVHYCPLPGALGVDDGVEAASGMRPALHVAPDGGFSLIADTPMHVTIHAMDGRMVLRQRLVPGLQYATGTIPPGVFTYTLSGSGGQFGTGRFVLMK
ncbi:MAG: hypothetical protein IPM68_03690 [Flavobacteriales bacterium]|nr:hypothetical protein [Flavobacteriales bacterium]